jgi:NAD-dependent DNA ligase
MDIEGLGGENSGLLFNNDLVHNYADLYNWRENSSIGTDGTKICR